MSLYSQLTGGVVELKETQSERGFTADNKRNYDFKVFKHDAGGTKQEKEQNNFIVKPHHSLLQELEAELLSSGHLLDLNRLSSEQTLKDIKTRDILKQVLCVKCTGRIVIEDYERIKKVGQDFPEIIKLINRSHEDALKETAEYKKIEEEIINLDNTNHKDKGVRQTHKKRAKALKEQLEQLVASNSAIEIVPQWILDGLKTWIDAFLPNITSIRVYPFQEQSDEHVFGHLEASNFTLSNPTALHFTYGSFPTEEFTLLGIVTSVPSNQEECFSPLEEFKHGELKDEESVENGFRGVFRGFDGMEAMIRTCRYPRVMVHPVLVYRQASPYKN